MRYKLFKALLSWRYALIICQWLAMAVGDPAQVRCTRRYSVGSCPGHVQPVWTYVPHLQNCTQRLGCKTATISNRFATRNECILMCHGLQDLYTLYQASEPNNTNAMLRGRWGTVYNKLVNIGRSELEKESKVDSANDYTEATTDAGEPLEFHTEDVTPNRMYEALEPDNPDLAFWPGL